MHLPGLKRAALLPAAFLVLLAPRDHAQATTLSDSGAARPIGTQPRTGLTADGESGFSPTPGPVPIADPAAPRAPGAASESILELARGTTDVPLFDEGPDGTVWVRGRSYKASFAADAATVIPFFGSDAPQNYPIALRASGATLAGEPLASSGSARVSRSDRTVRIDRASFVEEYVVEEEQLEQRFVFETLPRRGELVLHIDVETELSVTEHGAALRFSNALGHVEYGEAFAIDAHGARIAIERGFDGGALSLTVPEAFVADAALPLTIDPFVSFFPVASGTIQKIAPDAAYDVNSGRWCVVYEDVFSAADHDVTAKLLSSTGAIQAILTIDATTDYWTTPKVANNRNVNSFLVVAAVDPAPVASNTGSIRGRRLNAVGATIGPVIQISPWDATERDMPDVGGDAFNGNNAHFCVVWQHHVNSSSIRIEMQMVTQNWALQGGVVTLDSTAGVNTRPSISNSNGLVSTNGPSAERWTVVWEHEFSPTDHDIYARQVAWDGALLSAALLVDGSGIDDREPAVASVLDPIAGQRYSLVVYQRDNGSDEDIMGRLLRGDTVLAARNLSADHAPSAPYRQLSPTVDSDGRHFLVGFAEIWQPFPVPDVWVSDYFVSGGALVPWLVHESFASSLDSESEIALYSKYSSGGSRQRYAAAWSFASSSTNAIEGGFWDGGLYGVTSTVCAGDGGGTACPCGNTGGSGLGCANSATGGAHLTALNGSSVSADSLVLHGSGMPASSTCLYFQGTALQASGAGVVFGDGKLCAGGSIIRLGIKANSGGASQFPSGGDPSVSVRGLVPADGATRFYQVWYRDPAAFCTSSTFNLTNGLQVVWAP